MDVVKAVYDLAESKYFDTGNVQSPLSSPVTSTGMITDLSFISQGVANNERTGDRIRVYRIFFNLFISNFGVSEGFVPKLSYCLRIIIFKWKDENNPTIDDILDDTVLTSTLQSPIMFYRFDKMRKRHILYDNVFNGSYETTTGIEGISQTHNIEVKEEFDINYISGTTTGINKVYLLMISNTETIPSPNSTWVTTWMSRILYKDF